WENDGMFVSPFKPSVGGLGYSQQTGSADPGKQTAITSKLLPLELHQKRDRAAAIRHLIIENAMIRLVCRQRGYGAYRKIFVQAIIRGKRKNFADVIATALPILAHHDGTNSVDVERTRQNHGVTKVSAVLVSAR